MSEGIEIGSDELGAGEVLGERYEVRERLAVGGMGTVYVGRDLQDPERPVAIKVLHRSFHNDNSLVARFIQEAKLLNTIDHINVVKTYDIAVEPGLVYLVTEYITGQPLDLVIAEQDIPFESLPELIQQICSGLEAVHKRGIIHRDLKPENILVQDDGTVKIIDFGAARSPKSRLTLAGQKIGSAPYIAPEVWIEKRLTPAVDFYSLGVILYEIATGKLPFEALRAQDLMLLHVRKDAVPPKELNPDVPDWLSNLIQKLLNKNPATRYQEADQVMEFVYRSRNSNFGGEKRRPRVFQPLPDQSRVSSGTSKSIGSVEAARAGRRTFVVNLGATKVMQALDSEESKARRRRKATVMIPLPRKAALVLEIESPSRDFIYFGLFLASLQVADGILTASGVARYGTQAEGNWILRMLMESFSPHSALIATKVAAICVVIGLTVVAKRMRWIKDLIGVLSCIYLTAAIIPWVQVLFLSH